MKKKIREQIENKIIVQLMDNIIGQKHHQHHHVHIHQKKRNVINKQTIELQREKKRQQKFLSFNFSFEINSR